MNIMKWRELIAAKFIAVMKFIATSWEFLGDTSPWFKRDMKLREPDGTVVQALILSQEDTAYTIEIRRSEPGLFTFWLYEAETRVVFQDDHNIISIDPPRDWCGRVIASH